MSDALNVLGGGGAPSAKLKEEGDTVEGTVISTRETQQRKFAGANKIGDLEFWDKEQTQPKMQIEATLSTEEGPRRVFIKGCLLKELQKHAAENPEWDGSLPEGTGIKIRRGKKGGGEYGNDVAYQVRVTPAPAVSVAPKAAPAETEEVPF